MFPLFSSSLLNLVQIFVITCHSTVGHLVLMLTLYICCFQENESKQSHFLVWFLALLPRKSCNIAIFKIIVPPFSPIALEEHIPTSTVPNTGTPKRTVPISITSNIFILHKKGQISPSLNALGLHGHATSQDSTIAFSNQSLLKQTEDFNCVPLFDCSSLINNYNLKAQREWKHRFIFFSLGLKSFCGG